jgi:hypothetical protein
MIEVLSGLVRIGIVLWLVLAALQALTDYLDLDFNL